VKFFGPLSSTTAERRRAGTPMGGRRDGIQGLSGWRIQWRVVDALVYRELRTRVSEVRGGFLGVLLQPLGLLAIWLVFLAAINLNRGGSLNIVLFLTSGIISFSIFNHIASRSLNAMDANEALLFYRPVKPIDTVIARALCETGLYICCYIVILVGTWIYLDQVVMADFGLFLISLLLTSVLGFSTGLIFMTAAHIAPWFSQVAAWVPRVLWFLSGIPFRYWLFPAWTRPFFVWNPLMHCIELNRRSLSDDYFTPDANLQYVIIWVVVQTTLALWIYANNERRLLTL
jgi:capsular polysaccharide transport system permease protein